MSIKEYYLHIFRIRHYLETSLIFQRAEELPLANELESDDDHYGTGGGRSHTVKTDFRSIKSRSCLLRTPRLSLASEITHHLFVSGSGLYLTLGKIDKRRVIKKDFYLSFCKLGN